MSDRRYFATPQEVADFFGVPVSEVRLVLGQTGVNWSGHLHLPRLWGFLIAGAEQQAEVVSAVEDRWSKRVARTRAQLTTAVRSEVIARDGNRCRYCRKSVNQHTRQFDHVVPVAAGGGGTGDNVVVACRPCNVSKGDLTLHAWMDHPRFQGRGADVEAVRLIAVHGPAHIF